MITVELRLTKILLSSFSKIKNPEMISLVVMAYYKSGPSVNQTNASKIMIT